MPDPSPRDSALRCLRCGSDSVIPDVRLLDRGHGDDRRPQELGVQKHPDAMLFKDEVRVRTRAQVCADCGFVEAYAVDPEALWQAHLERIASGWR